MHRHSLVDGFLSAYLTLKELLSSPLIGTHIRYSLYLSPQPQSLEAITWSVGKILKGCGAPRLSDTSCTYASLSGSCHYQIWPVNTLLSDKLRLGLQKFLNRNKVQHAVIILPHPPYPTRTNRWPPLHLKIKHSYQGQLCLQINVGFSSPPQNLQLEISSNSFSCSGLPLNNIFWKWTILGPKKSINLSRFITFTIRLWLSFLFRSVRWRHFIAIISQQATWRVLLSQDSL